VEAIAAAANLPELARAGDVAEFHRIDVSK